MDPDNTPTGPGAPLEDIMMLIAREQEWAEAYVSDHPESPLAELYLDLLRREMVSLMAEF